MTLNELINGLHFIDRFEDLRELAKAIETRRRELVEERHNPPVMSRMEIRLMLRSLAQPGR